MSRTTSWITGAAAALLLATSAVGSVNAAEHQFDCVMDPATTVNVGSPVVGLLRDVLVQRGDRVQKGQVIARLQSDVEAANVALERLRAQSTAEIELRETQVQLSRRKLERSTILFKKQAASEEKMDELRAETEINERALALARLARETARLELARSEQVLRLREIRSPIDGIVTERTMYGGENVHQEAVILKLARLDPLHVEVFLPAKLYPAVKLGATVGVEPAAPIQGRFEAKVVVVDQVFDIASGTFGVRLELPNPGARLPAGHRCRAYFALAGS